MAVVVDFAMANVVVKGLTVGRTKYFPSQINKKTIYLLLHHKRIIFGKNGLFKKQRVKHFKVVVVSKNTPINATALYFFIRFPKKVIFSSK